MDKYDEAVKYFTKNPDKIYDCWNDPASSVHGCLFEFFRTRSVEFNLVRTLCATQARLYKDTAEVQNDDFLKRISMDENVPDDGLKIRLHHLPLFAKYQREYDTLNGVR